MNRDLLSRIDRRLDDWLHERVAAHRSECFPVHLVQRVCLRRDGSLHAGWHAYPYACGGINRSVGRVPGVRLGKHRCQHQHRSPNRLGGRHPGRHGYTVACTHACPSPSQFVDLCPNTGTGTDAGKVLSRLATKHAYAPARQSPHQPTHRTPSGLVSESGHHPGCRDAGKPLSRLPSLSSGQPVCRPADQHTRCPACRPRGLMPDLYAHPAATFRAVITANRL